VWPIVVARFLRVSSWAEPCQDRLCCLFREDTVDVYATAGTGFWLAGPCFKCVLATGDWSLARGLVFGGATVFVVGCAAGVA
jgi:hypothetical protein